VSLEPLLTAWANGQRLRPKLDRVNHRTLPEKMPLALDSSHPCSAPVVGLELVHDFDLLVYSGQLAPIPVGNVDVARLFGRGGHEQHPEVAGLGHGADDNSGRQGA
jgi:hypothetical protein